MNKNKGWKILLGFISIIILFFFQLIVSYKIQSGILNKIETIKNIENPLYVLTQKVIGYDTLLTLDIREAMLHTPKGDYNMVQSHKEDYDNVGSELDNILKYDARILISQSMRSQSLKDEAYGYLKNLDIYNLKLVDLELKSFEALKNKDSQLAYSLVVGGEYEQYKKEFAENVHNWEKLEDSISEMFYNDSLYNSHLLTIFNLIFSIGIIFLLIIVMLMTRDFFQEKYKSYELLYETSNDALMTLEPPNWNFTSGNDATIKLFGLKNEKEFLLCTPEDLSPERQPDGQTSKEKARKMIEKAMKEGYNIFNWVHKKYKGENFNANVLLSRIRRENGNTYLQATVRRTV